MKKETLLTLSDKEFFEALDKIEDQELKVILERQASFGRTALFEGELMHKDSPQDPNAYVSFPIKIKPGLESLVEFDGKILTLEDYLNLQLAKTLLVGSTIYTGLAFLQNHRWDIYKLETI